MQAATLSDLRAGFLVSLIALPLCLGIAMASGFPPVAGILTAIIGGVVSSFLGGSPLTIKGPAAGLIVVVLSAVSELGMGNFQAGYPKCLAVCVMAALFQIVFSKMGIGKIGNLVPPSVIHGMLAAIGIIIIAKQLHILFGVVPHGKSPLELIAEVPESFLQANPLIALIGVLTLSTMVLLPLLPSRWAKILPPACVALILVLPLAIAWHLDVVHSYALLNHSYVIGPQFLVAIPGNLLQSIVFPDFSALATLVGWKYVLMIAIVGTLESLLTVQAIDSLDPQKRRSDLNADLFSVGASNVISAMVGGLPMISEVVRSKANIDNGAKSQWSNTIHGLCLLIAVTCFASVLHHIPLSALAGMLIITGFRLSSPKEFHKTYAIGWDQAILFLTTLVVTLQTDLLLGVTAGLIAKLAIHAARGIEIRYLFKMPIRVLQTESSTILHVKGCALFSNYLHLERQINEAMQCPKKVVVDFAEVRVVDHTTLFQLKQLKHSFGPERLEIVGLDMLKAVSEHELATHRFSKVA